MPEFGQTISHFRIVEKIGQGGMGEVYLADDTTLDRRVALKFLPEVFTNDPERMARFEREAKLLASLNHPNIAGIYGLERADGNRFLVLEYVEGETLQARLRKGALPLEDALAICRQIAEGLEAAHEKGVVHRDLKPANVMITADETVKILDFGLAKALADETQGLDPADSPTITEAMTQPGVVLGTAAYMSPEQAKGKSVDKRADIWAFGCILYECLTVKKAFEGVTVTETLAAVIRGEPDWEKVAAKAERLLRSCLEKDPTRRLRDIGDAWRLLDNASESSSKSAPARRNRLAWIWTAITGILVIALGLLAFLYFRDREPAKAMYFDISVPPMPNDYSLAISPDGRTVAYVAITPAEQPSLFVREIGSADSMQLGGTEGAQFPFWSPDSRSIAFFAEQRLRIVDISGGPSRDICAAPTVYGGTWSDQEIIVVATWPVLRSVSVDGGEPMPITELDESEKEVAHTYPYFLPDGRRFLFTASSTQTKKVYVGSLDSKERKPLLTGISMATYAEPGYLLFQREGSLFARPFDPQKLEFTGEAVRIADNLLLNWREDWAAFSASQTGVLLYRAGGADENAQFIWFDRSGNHIGPAGEPDKYIPDFDLSPDGKQIAMQFRGDIWLLDWERNVRTLFTDNPALEIFPVWSPDGSRIAFSSYRNGNGDLFVKKVGEVGEERVLIDTPINENMDSWSKDGRYVTYRRDTGTGSSDIFVLPLSGNEKPFPIVQSPTAEFYADFSPDGKWIAYRSLESGTSQVYVVSFPAGGLKRQISNNGGVRPKWKQDGKELYYLALDGKLMAVDITLGTEVYSGTPHVLFDTKMTVLADWSRQYAATLDGQRFLVLKSVGEEAPKPITVVLNWTSLLEK
jgi:Tol biopolymer transport system component/predicted Ser/Thr protein kinase